MTFVLIAVSGVHQFLLQPAQVATGLQSAVRTCRAWGNTCRSGTVSGEKHLLRAGVDPLIPTGAITNKGSRGLDAKEGRGRLVPTGRNWSVERNRQRKSLSR